jgi:hypothetical protein
MELEERGSARGGSLKILWDETPSIPITSNR